MKNARNARHALGLILGIVLALLSVQTYAAERKVFYHNNLLGSPVAATDENGNLCWREDYRPYGEKLRNEDQGCGLDNNVTGFTGHVHDRDIGLTYMQARYYDPIVGRFMGVDPVGFKTSNSTLFNKYAYANNNPYLFIDPSGMEPGSADTYGPSWGSNDMGYADPHNYVAYKDWWSGEWDGYYTREISSWTYATEDMPELRALVGALLGYRVTRPTATPAPAPAKSPVSEPKLLPAPKQRGKPNTATKNGTIYVDSKGNTLVSPPGGRLAGSPDGRYKQIKDAVGKQTGTRIDDGHNPNSHPDQRAQQPHGHVPGVINPDGTAWLPIKI